MFEAFMKVVGCVESEEINEDQSYLDSTLRILGCEEVSVESFKQEVENAEREDAALNEASFNKDYPWAVSFIKKVPGFDSCESWKDVFKKLGNNATSGLKEALCVVGYVGSFVAEASGNPIAMASGKVIREYSFNNSSIFKKSKLQKKDIDGITKDFVNKYKTTRER